MKLNEFKFLNCVEIFILSKCGKKVLLLKRNRAKKVMPGYYAGLGGKMDSRHPETPYEAALRETLEEAGIKKSDLRNFKLKAVINAYDRFGKWVIFEFTGVLKKEIIKEHSTEEGELCWRALKDLHKIKLIPDLRGGVLEKILSAKNTLWIKSVFNKKDELIKKEIIQ